MYSVKVDFQLIDVIKTADSEIEKNIIEIELLDKLQNETEIFLSSGKIRVNYENFTRLKLLLMNTAETYFKDRYKTIFTNNPYKLTHHEIKENVIIIEFSNKEVE